MSLQLYGGPSRNTGKSGASRHDRIAVHADFSQWRRTVDQVCCYQTVPRWWVGFRSYSDSRNHIDVVGQAS